MCAHSCVVWLRFWADGSAYSLSAVAQASPQPGFTDSCQFSEGLLHWLYINIHSHLHIPLHIYLLRVLHTHQYRTTAVCVCVCVGYLSGAIAQLRLLLPCKSEYAGWWMLMYSSKYMLKSYISCFFMCHLMSMNFTKPERHTILMYYLLIWQIS